MEAMEARGALPEILTVDLGPRTHIRMKPRAADTGHWAIHVYIGEAKCRQRTLVRVHDRFGLVGNSEANSFSHTPRLFPFPLPSQTYKQLTQTFPGYLGTS